jgi:DnaJ-domain-containing protein 1
MLTLIAIIGVVIFFSVCIWVLTTHAKKERKITDHVFEASKEMHKSVSEMLDEVGGTKIVYSPREKKAEDMINKVLWGLIRSVFKMANPEKVVGRQIRNEIKKAEELLDKAQKNATRLGSIQAQQMVDDLQMSLSQIPSDNFRGSFSDLIQRIKEIEELATKISEATSFSDSEGQHAQKVNDYYTILGVKTDATQEEIKACFHDLSEIFHPDKNLGKRERIRKLAEEKFKEINEAYSVLSNPSKRREYDRKRGL